MSYRIDPGEEIDRLRATFDAYAALRERAGVAIDARAERVSGWSVAQHLYHVALATDLAFQNVLALAQGESGRIVLAGAPNALALRVLTDENYPRGESEAPRTVQPPNDIDPEFLADEMERNRAGLARVVDSVPAIVTAAGRILNVQLGELDAREWLRFARLHAEHHLAIALDVEARLARA